MRRTVSDDVRRLYPLKENRYKLVGSLIAHARKIMQASNRIDPFGDKSFNPDNQAVSEDTVKLTIRDYLDGKIEAKVDESC